MPKSAFIKREYLEAALQSAARQANTADFPQTYAEGLQKGYANALLTACDILRTVEDAPRRNVPVLFHRPETRDRGNILPGFVSRDRMDALLTSAIQDNAKKVIPTDANLAAGIGLTLGFADGLRAAKKMVHDLEDEPRPAFPQPWC